MCSLWLPSVLALAVLTGAEQAKVVADITEGLLPECLAYLDKKNLQSPAELEKLLTKCSAPRKGGSGHGAGFAPDPRPSMPGVADTSDLSCEYGNYQNDKRGTCCGMRPHFNWVVATCEGGDSLFCRNLPECVRNGSPKINYVASYQYNGSHFVLVDDSSAGDLSDAGISGSFTAGTGWERHKEKFAWQGGDWTTKYAPWGNGSSGPRGLTPPGAMWVLSAENFYYAAFYMLSQLTLNLQGHHNPTGTNCWMWEFDALEGSMGWIPTGEPMPGNLNQVYVTNNAAISGCMPVSYTALQANGGRPKFSFPEDFQDYCRANPKAAGCSPWKEKKNVWWSGGAEGSQRFENTWDTPYVFAVVIDQKGYWVYRWIPDETGKTGWTGISRTKANRVLPAHPARTVKDPRGLATDVRGDVPEAVVLQPGLSPEAACLRASMEATNFQFGSNALGAIAEELRGGSGSASTDLEGAQNWWAHFADTGQHSMQYPLSIAGIPKAELSKTYSCNTPSSFSCNCSLPSESLKKAAKAPAQESPVQRLGVNFAIPADAGDPAVLARQAAALGVTKIKLFDYSADTIYQCRRAYALAQKKVEIMVAIPQWISNPPDGHGPRNNTNIANLLKTVRENTDIVVGVFVYNEPCINGFCDGQAGEDYFSLLNYLADELKDEGKIVTTPFSMGGILQQPPHSNVLLRWGFTKRLVAALAKTKAPVAFNVYPYLDYIGAAGNVQLPYALGTAQQAGQQAPSQIDWDLNALRQALNSLGEDGVKTPIMIGETGWAHNFGPDPGSQDYWKKRVFDISNYNNANTYYTNLAQRLPGYVKQWNLHAIYIFGLADEPTKPLRNPACGHGQPIGLWVQFQCGAYEGERWFGITGLWKDTSKSPWNLDGSQQHQSDAPIMREEDWKTFFAQRGQQEWIEKHQPEFAKIAKEKLKEDAQLIKLMARQEHGPHQHHHRQHNPHHYRKHHAEEQKWEENSGQPIASRPVLLATISVALVAAAVFAAALAFALVARRGAGQAAGAKRLLQVSSDEEKPLETCLD